MASLQAGACRLLTFNYSFLQQKTNISVKTSEIIAQLESNSQIKKKNKGNLLYPFMLFFCSNTNGASAIEKKKEK